MTPSNGLIFLFDGLALFLAPLMLLWWVLFSKGPPPREISSGANILVTKSIALVKFEFYFPKGPPSREISSGANILVTKSLALVEF